MIYLDNAATSFPKPNSVIDAVTESIKSGAGTPGRGNHASATRATAAVEEVRRKLGRFFGVFDDYRTIFTYSATDALNTAIKGVLDQGDHVIISAMEHNSTSRPLKRLAKEGFISLSIVEATTEGYIKLDKLKDAITEKTKLVAINHGSNVVGSVQPIDKISKIVRESSKGALLLVDAAQTAGRVHIDVIKQNIDLLAIAGHKGIFGLQGTGALVLGERIKKLRPFREGGTGFDSQSETQPVAWPEAFESGTHNVPGILSMGAGLDFIAEIGIDNITSKEAELTKLLWEGLSKYDNITVYGPTPDKDRVAVISFNIDGWEPDDIGEIMSQNHDIRVRSGLQCAPLAHQTIGTFPEGTARVSPGYFNSEEDINKFLNSLRLIASTNVPIF